MNERIERVKLSVLSDSHFCSITDPRPYRNRNYRSLSVEKWNSGGRQQVLNVLQVSNYKALRDLKMRYADELRGVAVSAIEHCIDRLEFGLGDVRENAPSLVLHFDKLGLTASGIARWMKANCESNVLLLEGNRLTRASFESENDFMLTRLNFL